MSGKPINTTILTAGPGTNLQAVLDTRFFGEIPNMELTAVLAAEPGCFALERARLAGVPAWAVDRALFPTQASFDRAVSDKLDDLDTELVVQAEWDYPLPPEVARRWARRVLTVHPALLPLYDDAVRSPLAVQELVLQSGALVTGATACLLEKDGLPGPIILQRTVPVQPEDTPETLLRRVTEEAGRLLLPKALAMFCSGRLCIHGRQTKLLPVLDGPNPNE